MPRLRTSFWRNEKTVLVSQKMDALRDNPELRPFVLANVRLTGTGIGAGAYGRVDEVDIPVRAAAKTIYDVLHDSPTPDDSVP